MLSSDFKEKSALEIPLPEKKAEEIEQLLKANYPDREFRIIKNNCFFLLTLSFDGRRSHGTNSLKSNVSVERHNSSRLHEKICVSGTFWKDLKKTQVVP